MTNRKLNWEEISKLYDRQWVQLIEYDWPEEEPLPRAGVVRVHAKTRKEFDCLINEDPPPDSALIFVGERILKPGIIYSVNR